MSVFKEGKSISNLLKEAEDTLKRLMSLRSGVNAASDEQIESVADEQTEPVADEPIEPVTEEQMDPVAEEQGRVRRPGAKRARGRKAGRVHRPGAEAAAEEQAPSIAPEQSEPVGEGRAVSVAPEQSEPVAGEQAASVGDEQAISEKSMSPPRAPKERPTEDGAVILDEIAAGIRRHVVLPDGAAETIALFVIHTYAYQAAQFSPLLSIVSPVMGCGKTTLLSVLNELTFSPLFVTDLTPAGLYHTTTFSKHTLLIDEVQDLLPRNKLLQSILNGGHCRAGARVLRADSVYNVWCPKVVALIGELPSTLRDRSIRICLERKRPHEVVAPLDAAAIARLKKLPTCAVTWLAEKFKQIAAANPAMPAGVINRTCDNWRTLIAIADAAGGRWPELARSLAVKAAAETESSPGVLLLHDIRQVAQDEGADRLATANLLDALNSNEDMPWGDWNKGRPLTAAQLAQMLRPFNIHPRTIRFGTDTAKGYYLSDFEDAFERYL